MSNEFVRFGYVSGEISPALYGRSDLEKYDLGLALAYNFIVDYRGGLTTRPGTQFGDYIKFDERRNKFFKFVFAPDTANTYILLFGHEYVRFIQDNAYVLENSVAVLDIAFGLPTTILTTAPHGYSNGDWFYMSSVGGMTELNGRLFVVSDSTADAFFLTDVFGDYVDSTAFSAYTSGGLLRRIYTVTTPYASSDLLTLKADQIRDTIRLTHPDYPPHDLIRTDHADWDITPSTFGNNVDAPENVVATSSGSAGSPPGSSCAYAVTAVDFDGNESVASNRAYITNARNMTAVPATYQVAWDVQADIAFYNVYRSIVRDESGTEVGQSAEIGYTGRSYGTNFFDQNVIPDFTHTPPRNIRPFADGRVERINVSGGASDYTNSAVVGITSATGSGFIGYPIVQIDFNDTTGPLVGIVIVDPGHDYRDTDTVTVSVGSGANFDLVVGELTGNFPRVSTTFQQREIYAGTDNDPMTVWGSQPGKFSNFDTSSIVLDSDSYEHEIDGSVVAPIKHLTATRGGLLVWSEAGLWILSGENGAALTPKNPLADPQSYVGISDVPPVRIATDLLYIEDVGSTARLLSYKDTAKVYSGEDISILSSHFFNPFNPILAMDYSAAPSKVVWAPRADGSMLSFTILREQNIYAWTQCWTRGEYQDVIVVKEGSRDATYVIVERTINGNVAKFFERMMPHGWDEGSGVRSEFRFIEDAWCVDCGLSLATNHPAGTIRFEAIDGNDVAATASASVFALADVGKIIRASGAKAEIIEYVTPRRVKVNFLRPVLDIIPFSDPPVAQRTTAWTMDEPVTVISGLGHLEGEKVVALMDGNVFRGTVVDGSITAPAGVTRAVVGLGYVCDARTLPVAASDAPIEGRRKRVVGAVVNRMQSRGLQVGTDFTTMYDLKERTNETMGEPIELQNGSKYVLVGQAEWTYDASVCIRQADPLPSTVRAMVMDMEVGDDPQ